MGRLVEPVSNEAAPFAKGGSKYAETVAKYVPAETVAAYLPLSGLLSAQPQDGVRVTLEWVLVGLGVMFTVLYLRRHKEVPEQSRHIVISTLAFVLWAAALGGPFTRLPGYREYVPAVMVGIFTWVVGLFPPRRRVALRRPVVPTKEDKPPPADGQPTKDDRIGPGRSASSG